MDRINLYLGRSDKDHIGIIHLFKNQFDSPEERTQIVYCGAIFYYQLKDIFVNENYTPNKIMASNLELCKQIILENISKSSLTKCSDVIVFEGLVWGLDYNIKRDEAICFVNGKKYVLWNGCQNEYKILS